MEKVGTKGRKIKFFSRKNNCVIYVHSREQKMFAEILENDQNVKSYEAIKDLDINRYSRVNPINIRREYFEIAWSSDFVIHYQGGAIGIREIVSSKNIYKKAVIEKLELSRRYWLSLEIKDWKIIMLGGN